MDRPTRDDLANALTHAVGILASALGGTALIVWTALHGDPWKIVGVSIFVGTLVLLYGASTAYHTARRPEVRARLKVLDHGAIYLLIAGTYTPFMIGDLRGGWGWSLLGVVWGLAIAGVIFKLFYAGRFNRLSTALYVAMGWLIVIAVGPMIHHLPLATLLWLLAGGLAYTGGTAFYHSRRIPYAHAIWHIFVLLGSLCHALAVGVAVRG